MSQTPTLTLIFIKSHIGLIYLIPKTTTTVTQGVIKLAKQDPPLAAVTKIHEISYQK